MNCAGILGNNQLSTNTSLPEFDRINDINYRGCWLSSRAELKAMLAQKPQPNILNDPMRPAARGVIVNIASQLGMVGRPRCSECYKFYFHHSNTNSSSSCILCFQSRSNSNDPWRRHRLRRTWYPNQLHLPRNHRHANDKQRSTSVRNARCQRRNSTHAEERKTRGSRGLCALFMLSESKFRARCEFGRRWWVCD